MKKAIIISFDLIRSGDLKKSLAIGSIMAYAKQHEFYTKEFTVENISINAFETINNGHQQLFDQHLADLKLSEIDTIAISSYVWSEYLINPLISYLRKKGFQNKIVLGGYQITYGAKEQLKNDYPECDIFISGYAEVGLVEAILTEKKSEKHFINKAIDFENIPSPYLTNELLIPNDQAMIRMETKRGCPYRCTFCAHRDLTNNKVHKGSLQKVFEELKLFREKGVKRVNILDPIFNVGKNYLAILEEIDRLNFKNTTFTLQTRPELIKRAKGEQFLSIVKKTNAYLEFGLQTIIPEEYNAIGRPNNQEHIETLFADLNKMDIGYEVSLIYGLPNQTVQSFQQSIDFLNQNGCHKITAFPLMLLKGTELYRQKANWAMKEEPLGDFNIPTVTSSNSFNKSDWLEMQGIANDLMTNVRV